MNPPSYEQIPDVLSHALNTLCRVVNDWATKKGWNEGEDSISHKAEQIALMHSELSECLEFIRKRLPEFCPTCLERAYIKEIQGDNKHYWCDTCYTKYLKPVAMDDHVPSLTGEAAELADVLIRIFHYCGKRNIDLGEAVRLKHGYNTTRPYRHGKHI